MYGCSCRVKVRGTAVVFEFLDLMELSSIAIKINGYAYIGFFLNSTLNSQFYRKIIPLV